MQEAGHVDWGRPVWVGTSVRRLRNGGARWAPPSYELSGSGSYGVGAGGLRNPPNRPGKYSKAPERPMWSGFSASHWAA